MYTVELIITPRPGVRDPQAEAVEEALHGLPAAAAAAAPHVLCVGRYLRLQLATPDAATALAQAEQLCRQILVNPNLETFELRLEKAGT
jgi:phosphoribosylformylglycinamidine synthase